MSDDHVTNISKFRLTARMAEKKINSAARVSDNVIVDDQVWEWAANYAVFDIHVYEILEFCSAVTEPKKNSLGDWECIMTYKLRGRAEVYAATVIICSGTANGKIYLEELAWRDS